MSDEIRAYYEAYSRRVFLYLMTLCGDPDLAEDLMQETFYRAIRSVGKFRGDCPVYTWLCSIAKNLYKNEMRRQRYHPVAQADDTAPDPALRPDELTEERDDKRRALQCLYALPEPEKQVMLLHLSEELTFREIGAMLGKSENWARVTFYRAKQKIIREMKL